MADEQSKATIPLSKTTKFIVDNRGRTAPTASSGIALIATNCISNEKLYPAYESIRYVDQETYDNWFRAHPLPGDIILTLKGSQNGAVCLVPDPVDFVIAQDMVALRANEDVIDPLFLFAALRSPHAQWQIKNLDVSGVIPHFKKTDFDKLHVPFPSRPVQSFIGRTYFNLSAKIELNRRRNRTLESMARAIFQSWFVDFDPVRAKAAGNKPAGMSKEIAGLFPDSLEESVIGPIPRGWTITTLGGETDFLAGFAFKSNQFINDPSGVRLARGDNVKEGFFYWGDKSRYWPQLTPDISRYALQTGDTLIGMDGSKVGKNWSRVRICDLPCLLVQRVTRLRPAMSVGDAFIALLVSDQRFQGYVDSVKTGTSIPHISGGQIQRYEFVRPTRGDNRLFVEFEKIAGSFFRLADSAHCQNQTLTSLRDALLPKLISGELRVLDAERIVGRAT